MKARWIGWMVVRVLVALVILLPAVGLGVFYLWNWLMPALFGLHAVTFWQAVGLVGLSWILFRGPRLGRPGWGPRGGMWMMRRRWAAMTPEQREEFKRRWQGRCGDVAPAQPA
jgi:hypothetical protein